MVKQRAHWPAWLISAGALLALLARPAAAGPPFVSDDPEPTDTGHFEIYTFNNGTNTRAGTAGETGIDFNYGAARDLQLTATLPAGYNDTGGGGTRVGLGNVELAAKYRFLHQDTFGLDVSVFPRVFLPSGSGAIGDNHASLLLPIWVQKDFGKQWSAFGGGGCTFNEIRAANFCQAGAVLTYQVLPKLQIGGELFHQTADSQGTPATTSLGLGWRYDVTDNYHLLGYIRRSIENTDDTGRYSWYASVLFTF
ncbi:transporter [Bradyrhizobium commune]|uniref:transporter n=1 Tax=Bradyrhizobium commune TaxID=83627 RepID=UPI001FF04B0D|nr:transporter [Bradyrhizobium commune]